MDNQHADEIDKLLQRYKDGRVRLIQQTAGIALNFFKNSFRNQGFTDTALKKWPKRIGGPKNKGRALLVNSGALKRGLRIKRADATSAVVGVDDAVKYAEIHNDGGEIPLTPKMRRFFWAMYYQTGKKGKVANFWKNMALSKKTSITIPKRQFIGDSQTLTRKLITFIESELTKLFNV